LSLNGTSGIACEISGLRPFDVFVAQVRPLL
jgi:hypothetical protein